MVSSLERDSISKTQADYKSTVPLGPRLISWPRAKVSAGAWRRPQGALQRGVSADFHVMGLVSLPLTQEKREVQEWFLLVMSREISDALEMSEGS